MDERHRTQCLTQARRMLDVAASIDAPAAMRWTPRSREVGRVVAAYLRDEAERLQRRADIGGIALLGRLSTRTARLEQLLVELGRLETRVDELRTDAEGQSGRLRERAQKALEQWEDNLHEARLRLRDFLESQQNRGPYEELAEVLRSLVEIEEDRGRRLKADSYRDILKQFEARLDSGDFDQARPAEEAERDQKILEYFQAILDRTLSGQDEVPQVAEGQE